MLFALKKQINKLTMNSKVNVTLNVCLLFFMKKWKLHIQKDYLKHSPILHLLRCMHILQFTTLFSYSKALRRFNPFTTKTNLHQSPISALWIYYACRTTSCHQNYQKFLPLSLSPCSAILAHESPVLKQEEAVKTKKAQLQIIRGY